MKLSIILVLVLALTAAYCMEYGRRRSSGFGRRESSGYGRRESSGFGGRESSGYGRRESSGFGRRESSGYGRRESSGFGGRESSGYGRRESSGFGRRESSGYGKQQSGYGEENGEVDYKLKYEIYLPEDQHDSSANWMVEKDRQTAHHTLDQTHPYGAKSDVYYSQESDH